ncbi:hypothetical protein [Psychromonas sp.]|uniref:hypothetical protein n=1 Tax=Psychromonas sp. TaxID=1884585 RepID=UPI0035654D4A
MENKKENKIMKKTILAVTLAATLLSGCSAIMGNETRSYDELKADGQALLLKSNEEGYSASGIQDLEKIRLGVNSAFLIAEPMYERYTENLLNTPELGNFMAATEAAESEEEKKAIYDALPQETKDKVDAYLNSSMTQEVMKGAAEVAKVILKNSTAFLTVNTTSVLTQIDFTDLMAEKARIAHTADQLAYLDTTLVSAYKNYKVISAFSNAQ